MIRNQLVLLILEMLGKNTSAAKTLVISHLADLSLYISSVEEILLLIRDADAFVKHDHKRSPSLQIRSIDMVGPFWMNCSFVNLS